MLILLPLVIAVVTGIGMHYGAPNRHSRGVALAPAIATAVAAIVWAAMTWLGFAENNPWIWLASIVVPILITYPATLWLARARAAHDAAEAAALGVA